MHRYCIGLASLFKLHLKKCFKCIKYLSNAARQFCALERCAGVDDRLSPSVSGAPGFSSAVYLQAQRTPSCNKTAPSSGTKSLEMVDNIITLTYLWAVLHFI